jgi:hypothetical protein
MTVYDKNSYDDQDDRRIFKATRKQQYIIFSAPIAFLNDEKEDEVKCCAIRVPIDASYKDSKMFIVKICKYDIWGRWRNSSSGG